MIGVRPKKDDVSFAPGLGFRSRWHPGAGSDSIYRITITPIAATFVILMGCEVNSFLFRGV